MNEHLKQLEAESIYIMREVAAQFERPALLFSGGKDSITLVHFGYQGICPYEDSFSFGTYRHRTQLP